MYSVQCEVCSVEGEKLGQMEGSRSKGEGEKMMVYHRRMDIAKSLRSSGTDD